MNKPAESKPTQQPQTRKRATEIEPAPKTILKLRGLQAVSKTPVAAPVKADPHPGEPHYVDDERIASQNVIAVLGAKIDSQGARIDVKFSRIEAQITEVRAEIKAQGARETL